MLMDKRKLESVYYMTVKDITFASDAIGAASGTGRSATTTWDADQTVVFKGKLKHILNFAVMAFDVASVAINELFTLTPERDFVNMPTPGDVGVINLDPAEGEGIVVDADMTFLNDFTNGYRLGWDDRYNLVVEEKADSTNLALYAASVLEGFIYAMQYHSTGDAPVYTLYDFAMSKAGTGYNKGVSYIDIDGTQGPVEIEKAHVTLANAILNA